MKDPQNLDAIVNRAVQDQYFSKARNRKSTNNSDCWYLHPEFPPYVGVSAQKLKRVMSRQQKTVAQF